MNTENNRMPFLLAIVPIVYLIAALTINVFIFGDDGLSGSNQIVILSAAAVAALIAMAKGSDWHTLQEGIKSNLNAASVAILILLLVGALTGTWLVSGIVPIMIYYGLQILSPEVFLPATLIICAMVCLATGSSWTTAATIGIALMGVGSALGMNPGMVAGAVISGSYFGDKMSPLSDTTNLASGVVGVPLFEHIRYMSLTTIPSILISVVMFLVLGLTLDVSEQVLEVSTIQATLNEHFDLNPLLLIAPAAVVLMVTRKVSSLPAIFVGVVLGAVLAIIFQTDLVRSIGTEAIGSGSSAKTIYAGISQVIFGDVAVATGNETIDDLLTSSGMAGMLNTIWLIIAAMAFGGVLDASGMLKAITDAIIRKARSAKALVSWTAGTCILVNATASDQYLALVLPGKMYHDSYERFGLAPQNLSRTIEDSGTVTSVLIPWNTCGAYHAGVLGVATLSYAPYCFFSIISPMMTVFFSVAGIKIAKLVIDKAKC